MTSAANSYYRINRILLECVGLWPYQNSNYRRAIMAIVSVLLVSGVVLQLTTFVTAEFSVDLLLKILAHCTPWLSYMLKYNVLSSNIKKMRDLMEHVRSDWNELNTMQEVEIIKKYSAFGKLITVVATSFIYLCILCVIVEQISMNLYLDFTTAANESRIREFPALIECFIDHQKYFYPILSYMFLVIVCGQTTMIATETLYMTYTQHACGLFEIANCRIEQALLITVMQDTASSLEKQSIVWQGIIGAVNMHRRAIEFIEISKANFTFAYFLVLPLGVLSLSVNLYRLARLLPIKEYEEANVSFFLVFGHLWYFFFVNYLGQKVIDHSGNIFHKTYNAQWYVAPVKVQKLLWLVMQRSLRHCTNVVGGLFVPSLEGFASVKFRKQHHLSNIFQQKFKFSSRYFVFQITGASISYFMVIYSVH
ncbi:uncharacterized protein LOC105287134 isoform X1 [Ooceraea biroi]|uniref:uncharacterized protein LOC105287134 isoform X1 n=1 Tax=Ooceraea biroi TaxID=2015173 RepID=UPI0005BD0891|nr:uncharacterized protein LOC105287134 isoform X1 [Ooceraea biroi]